MASSSGAHRVEGNEKFKLHDFRGAILSYQAAIAVNSQDVAAYSNLSAALLATGRAGEAADASTRGLGALFAPQGATSVDADKPSLDTNSWKLAAKAAYRGATGLAQCGMTGAARQLAAVGDGAAALCPEGDRPGTSFATQLKAQLDGANAAWRQVPEPSGQAGLVEQLLEAAQAIASGAEHDEASTTGGTEGVSAAIGSASVPASGAGTDGPAAAPPTRPPATPSSYPALGAVTQTRRRALRVERAAAAPHPSLPKGAKAPPAPEYTALSAPLEAVLGAAWLAGGVPSAGLERLRAAEGRWGDVEGAIAAAGRVGGIAAKAAAAGASFGPEGAGLEGGEAGVGAGLCSPRGRRVLSVLVSLALCSLGRYDEASAALGEGGKSGAAGGVSGGLEGRLSSAFATRGTAKAAAAAAFKAKNLVEAAKLYGAMEAVDFESVPRAVGRALQIGGNSAAVGCNRSVALLGAGKAEEAARTAFQTAVRYPLSERAWHRLANACRAGLERPGGGGEEAGALRNLLSGAVDALSCLEDYAAPAVGALPPSGGAPWLVDGVSGAASRGGLGRDARRARAALGAAGAGAGVRAIGSDSEFSAIAKGATGSGAVLVVDYHATWCGPCKALAPHYAALAGRFGGPRCVFLKADGDVCTGLVQGAGVTAFPTVHAYWPATGTKLGELRGADPAALGRVVEQAVGKGKVARGRAMARARAAGGAVSGEDERCAGEVGPAVADAALVLAVREALGAGAAMGWMEVGRREPLAE